MSLIINVSVINPSLIAKLYFHCYHYYKFYYHYYYHYHHHHHYYYKGCTLEVWVWISNFIIYFNGHDYLSMWESKLIHVSKSGNWWGIQYLPLTLTNFDNKRNRDNTSTMYICIWQMNASICKIETKWNHIFRPMPCLFRSDDVHNVHWMLRWIIIS